MSDARTTNARRFSALIPLFAVLVASPGARGAPGDDVFEFAPLGGAMLTSLGDQLVVEHPSPTGEFGVAARRIAIGEAGVKEHVSTLKVGWPDPDGLTITPDSSVGTYLIADTNPDGVGNPVRASSVVLTKHPESGGLTRYGMSFDFAQLGSATATLRVYNGSSLVAEDLMFGSGSSISLDGLPPGKPVVRTVKIPPGIYCNWRDDDSDGDEVFDVDILEVSLLPLNFAGFTLPDGSVFTSAADRLELVLNGPETELDGVFGFDYTGSDLSSFTISEVPAPGSLALLGLGVGGLARRSRRGRAPVGAG